MQVEHSTSDPAGFDARARLHDAIAFAAHAHRHQIRKDGRTPYAAHVFRVMFTVRDVAGITDPEVLAAAVLHDTIEDTTTDRDDLIARFGPRVAGWVAALTKDMRLPEEEREAAYRAGLVRAGSEVLAVKLADIFDNLMDLPNIEPGRNPSNSLSKSRELLAHLSPHVPASLRALHSRVEALADHIEARLRSTGRL